MFEQTYYQSILDSNPEYITQNQMRQICHISKRTCRYLLESGLVPNIDNGKKTHRYKIRTVDVVEYLQQREFSPSLFQAPEGYYAKKKRFEDMFSENDFVIMRGFYTDQLKSYSDVMNTAEISTFTGYSKNAVEHWCAKGYLKHFTTRCHYRVPKECLIDFLVSKPFISINIQPLRHKWFNIKILQLLTQSRNNQVTV